jgi:hypothetical protein
MRPFNTAAVAALMPAMLVALLASAAPASGATGYISTVAGNFTPGSYGEGLPAREALLRVPTYVVPVPDGGFLIADQGNHMVRKVRPDGIIEAVAGGGIQGFSGDGQDARNARFNTINDIEPTADGGYLIADSENDRIRKVDANGVITTVAGTTQGFSGDGGLAVSAQLNFPIGVAELPDGSFLIGDNDNNRVRRVDRTTGIITTVAGDNTFAVGDGGPATAAGIIDPADIDLAADGSVLVAELGGHRVRRFTLGGNIETVAGKGGFTSDSSGDGGPAKDAGINGPGGVTALADGGFLVSERYGNRVRRVSADGIITTAAGGGPGGVDSNGDATNGDGGPATQATLNDPIGVSVNAEGDWLIAEAGRHQIRSVDSGDPPPVDTPPPPPADPPAPPVIPVNDEKPTVTESAGGTYTCNPGRWRNTTADFIYEWRVVRVTGPRVVARTQTFRPPTEIFGERVVCVAAAPGPTGPVLAFSSEVFFTSGGLNRNPSSYGDVRVRGIDVFQVVQPNANARFFNYPGGFPFSSVDCGGGTPTAFAALFACGVGTVPEPYPAYQRTGYRGVVLDEAKRTTAIAYVDMNRTLAANRTLRYTVELSGTRGGRSLGAPLVKTINDPPRSNSPIVTTNERTTTANGVQFLLPRSWTEEGKIELKATVKFPSYLTYGTAEFGTRECDGRDCDWNNTFELTTIPFQGFPQLVLASLELRRAGQGSLTPAANVLRDARLMMPGGNRIKVLPYATTLDVTAAQNARPIRLPTPVTPLWVCGGQAALTEAGINVRSCRSDMINRQIRQWITDNPARRRRSGSIAGGWIAPYDAVIGVHNYDAPGFTEPGWAVRNIGNVSTSGPTEANGTAFFTATADSRPITAASHELGHVLTSPHAGSDPACYGPGEQSPSDEFWPDDNRGRLQGIMAPAFVLGPLQTTIDGTDRDLFDLMSYCAREPTAWLSPRNWNRYVTELTALGNRVGLADRPRVLTDAAAKTLERRHKLTQAQAGGSAPSFAVGMLSESAGEISRVVPPDESDAAIESVPDSPYRLKSLAADGSVLLDAGVELQVDTLHGGGRTGTFVGPVARGAVAVELSSNGTVFDRVEQSQAPTVKLAAPTKSTTVPARKDLTVRWTTTDADTKELETTVDFAPDGKNWRGVYQGPNTGSATVPAEFLAAGTKARVRVNVNDGFKEVSAISDPFTVVGPPPLPTISSPQPNALLRAGEVTTLEGSAQNDQGLAIGKKKLTWFLGSKKLGNGATLKVKLPAGKGKLRLVAEDTGARRGAAEVPITVEKLPLVITKLKLPATLKKGAATGTVTITASANSVLTAGGKRYKLRKGKSTKVKVKLPKSPVTGVANVKFTLKSTDKFTSGTMKGNFAFMRV